MNKIKEILEQKGKAVSDSRIQEKLNEYELDTNSLSDVDAQTIAQELEAEAKPISGSLSTATAQAPAKSEPKQKRTRKNAKQVSLKDAIVHAAKETESELDSMETVIRAQKGAYVESRSTALVNEIRNTSTEIVESVTDKLLREEGDIDSFREIGEFFCSTLFPSVSNA